MADFSKQWCELNDPKMPWDFDIIEEANKLKPNTHIDIICEGFGFDQIGKDDKGDIIFGFRRNDAYTEWKTYNEIVMNNFKVDSVVASIIAKFERRARFGKEKYGTDLDRTDLDLEDYLQHALEEHMDAILYLNKALRIIRENKK